jgi:hypothetical protein
MFRNATDCARRRSGYCTLCYTDTPKRVTYLYLILAGYADTDTRIHHFSGFSFEKVCIRVSDTYCIGYPYPYSCNIECTCQCPPRVPSAIAPPSHPLSTTACPPQQKLLVHANAGNDGERSGSPRLLVAIYIVFQTGRTALARPEHDLARPDAARHY